MGTEFNDEGKRLYKELKKLQRTVIQNEGGLSDRQLKIFEEGQIDKWEDMFAEEANAAMQTTSSRLKSGISPFKKDKPRGSMPGLTQDPDSPPARTKPRTYIRAIPTPAQPPVGPRRGRGGDRYHGDAGAISTR